METTICQECNTKCVFKNDKRECRILTDTHFNRPCPFRKTKQELRKALYDYPITDGEELRRMKMMIKTGEE